jgi:hypothetical protein
VNEEYDLGIEEDGQYEATGGASEAEGEPRLYAGKYKSAEEMEQAYTEMQKVLGKQAKAIGGIRGLGFEIDDEGNVLQPYQEPEPTNYQQPETTDDDPNAAFWENPQQATMQIVQQITRQQKQARSNIEFQIAQRKNDPAFNAIAADYIQQMNAIDDNVMADPRAAAYYGETLFYMSLGKKAHQTAPQARTDPNTRRQLLSELGVEGPQTVDKPGGRDEINDKDRRMMAALELDPTAQKAVVDKWQSREDK